ncbi:MAG TPA: outer membrane protein assembly factor BamE [Burkholderiaceae bacterium]|nr:outer membrane protein assembly factor BamE [Burkholderiaceae bacterium]
MNTDIADPAAPPCARRASSHPPSLRTLALASLLAGVVLASVGCASKDPNRSGLLEPFRIDLPQGNYLTREQVDQVREGMTRDQVRFLLGTPLLGHVFHTDRWDYVFRFTHPNGQSETRRVTVRFADERVASIQADPLPLREDMNDPALPGYRPQQGKDGA